MNITAPDGSLVTDVPDGTTKAQFLAKWNVGKGPQSPAPSRTVPQSPGVMSALGNAFGDIWQGAKAGAGSVGTALAVPEGVKAESEAAHGNLAAMGRDITAHDPKDFEAWADPAERGARLALHAAGFISAPITGLGASAGKITERPVSQIAGKTAGKIAGSLADAATQIGATGGFGVAGKAAEAVDASEAAARGAKPATETAAGAVKKATDIPQPEPEKPAAAPSATKNLPALAAQPKLPAKPPEGMEGWKEREHAPPDVTGKNAFQMGRNIDEVLYRVTGNNEADKSRMLEYLENLPKEFQSPQFQEAAYREIENRLIDPTSPLSPDTKRFMDTDFGKLYAEQPQLYKTIQTQLGKWNPDWARDVLADDSLPNTREGYVHRIAKDKGSAYDAADPEGYKSRDPIAGGRTLSKDASSLKGRKYFVLQDAAGGRKFVPMKLADKAGEIGIGKTVKDSAGRTFTVKQPTTEEIERETANPQNGYQPVQYHKNLVVNTVDNVLRLRRVQRNLAVSESIKDAAESKGLLFFGKAASHAPRDFIPTRLPQFMGAKMAPPIAHALNDFYGQLPADMSGLEKLEAVNRFLTRSIFWNPLPHLQNIGASWMLARGADWVRPSAYGSMVRTGMKAINEVVKQGPLVQQMLRKGSALQYPRIANQNFLKLMIQRMGNEIDKDHEGWSDLARNFGFEVKEAGKTFLKDTGSGRKLEGQSESPSALVREIYKTAQKAMWLGSDIMMTQRVMELMEKAPPGTPMRNMSMEDAIKTAEKDIPNYRIPSQLWNGPGGRFASSFLQSPDAIMFGRYKYDQLSQIANIANDLARGSTSERKEALAKAIMLVGFTTAVLPLADYTLHKMTGWNNVRFKRSGPFAITDEVMRGIQGKEPAVSALAHIISPSPAMDISADVINQMHSMAYGGGEDHPIVDPRASPMGQVTQVGEYASGRVAPLQEVMEATRPGGLGKVAARNLGFQNIPKPTPGRIEKKLRHEAGKHEARDSIEQMIRKAFQ